MQDDHFSPAPLMYSIADNFFVTEYRIAIIMLRCLLMKIIILELLNMFALYLHYSAVRDNYFAVVDQTVQSIYIVYIYSVYCIVEGCLPNLYLNCPTQYLTDITDQTFCLIYEIKKLFLFSLYYF